ncbi:MAG TPA: tyrosine recombinase [Candidatus Merdenecus merdavium]|nr:tyrosine recombinase [Candidatus Merdenecus merdavium]
MKQEIDNFIVYMHEIKHTSNNTEISYKRDLYKMVQFLEGQGITRMDKITSTNLNSYMLHMEKQGLAASSISRSIASMKALFNYLFHMKEIEEDPSYLLKAPKVEKKKPEILSIKEMENLLNEPKTSTPKGCRDKAMLELLYATGMRVTELITLKMEHVNLSMNYIVCKDHEKERVIPFGESSKKALMMYLAGSREILLNGEESDILFTNCSGGQMSRQGFWKLVKSYGKKAGIVHEITPHTFRHSFAAHLVENGADLRSVQEMMGHSDISAMHVYMNLGSSKIRDVYAKTHPRG